MKKQHSFKSTKQWKKKVKTDGEKEEIEGREYMGKKELYLNKAQRKSLRKRKMGGGMKTEKVNHHRGLNRRHAATLRKEEKKGGEKHGTQQRNK